MVHVSPFLRLVLKLKLELPPLAVLNFVVSRSGFSISRMSKHHFPVIAAGETELSAHVSQLLFGRAL